MQISMFDGVKPFKITKPIRLITLFSGYDSQALSLKYLGIPFEHYKTSEWATKSIQALKDLHFSSDNTDYSGNMTVAEIKAWLSGRISSDYSTPLSYKQIERMSEKECFKLMGVKQEDFEVIRNNQSKSSCFHLAGDSIVTTVLMAIFGQMFDIDWKEKINEVIEEIVD